MNYRHSYHAGGFADVMKHVVLSLVIDYLKLKEAAFCYIDTHAGIGLYDMQKTNEAVRGIKKIIEFEGEHPAELQDYLDIVKKYQQHHQLQYYPGSPMIAHHLLRPHDRMILNELHPEDAKILQQQFRLDSEVMIHQRDAYEFLPAIVPPLQKRGVILMDPAFENKSEQQLIKTCLAKTLKRWPDATYILWYPVTASARWNLNNVVPESHLKKYLIAELIIASKAAKGLVGSDLLIINPPWTLQDSLTRVLAHLRTVLRED